MQAQFDQERVTHHLQSAEMRRQMNDISAALQNLTQQLTALKSVSEHAVGEKGQQIPARYDEQFAVQTARIDTLADAVYKADQSATETAKNVQDLVIGVENLGEHFKTMQERLDTEIQRRERATLNELLAKAPLPDQAAETTARPFPVSTYDFSTPTPVPSTMHVSQTNVIDLCSITSPQDSRPETPRLMDDQTMDMEVRFSAVRGSADVPSALELSAPIPMQFMPSQSVDQVVQPKFFEMGISQPEQSTIFGAPR